MGNQSIFYNKTPTIVIKIEILLVIAASIFDTKDRKGNPVPFCCNHASTNCHNKQITEKQSLARPHLFMQIKPASINWES